MALNKEQEKAANHINGPFMCIAGPGSGKTTVIINRVHHLIENGANPSKIMVITFTKAAAEEMEARYEKEFGTSGAYFGTIHSFCLKVINDSALPYGAGSVLNGRTKAWFLKKLAFSIQGLSFQDIDRFIKALELDISYVKNIQVPIKEYSPECVDDKKIFQYMYDKYEEFKRKERKIDFDDMLLLCRRLFEDPEVLAAYQSRYDYIMVDEFQDVNSLQADIIYALAEAKRNIFICGDDDQSIYGFRGSDPAIMLHFKDKFPETGSAYLTTNYRSDKNIVSRSAAFISANKERFAKDLAPASKGDGEVRIMEDTDIAESFLHILREIKGMNGTGTKYTDIAVLCRTNREIGDLVQLCLKLDIPYFVRGGIETLHTNWLYKIFAAYARYALGQEGGEDLLTIANFPSRYIKLDSIKRANSNLELMEKMARRAKDMRLVGSIGSLKSDIGTLQRYKDKPIHEFWDLMEVLLRIPSSIEGNCRFYRHDYEETMDIYEKIKEEVFRYKDIKEWMDAAAVNDAQVRRNGCGDKDGLTLSTMHCAKGLEWDYVYIANANDGMNPYIKRGKELTEGRLAEERRLFYVAATRARHECVVCCTPGDGVIPQLKIDPLYNLAIETGCQSVFAAYFSQGQKEIHQALAAGA